MNALDEMLDLQAHERRLQRLIAKADDVLSGRCRVCAAPTVWLEHVTTLTRDDGRKVSICGDCLALPIDRVFTFN